MGKPQGRSKKKTFGPRGADGRAVSKKPKPTQQHDLPSPGAGGALSGGHDGAILMDVDEEEGTAAADAQNTSGKGRRGGAGVGGFAGMPNLLRQEGEKDIQEVEAGKGEEAGHGAGGRGKRGRERCVVMCVF
ncbi:unnamed protein product [Ectocarpus sp. CCAP 1310/34]|nr:unnamed protein product [Ectocarpus sp. CCAP 1310/34]